MNKLDDLKKRTGSSIIAAVLVAIIIYFSNILFIKPLIAILICALSYVATLEYINFLKIKNVHLSPSLLIFFVIAEILAFFFYSMFPNLSLLPSLLIFVFFLAMFLVNFKSLEGSLKRISHSVFGFFYIAIPFSMFLPIIFIGNIEMQDGRMWILYLILVTKITDIAAYFFGKLFGKKKLAFKISPNKTIVGAVAGLVFATFTSIIFSFFSKENFFELNLIESIFLGLVLGVFSQFGDLCESLLKRDVKIKDSAKIPGLGGILDMIDSLTFNVPILYFYLIG
ncbi:MAG: hypothetical protein A3F40_03695 [Chlamydiae bacterium RIFCSPHIGHO2_12_FULL_27_8]|nr:MAG: hypothetical protein A3F40_03695 [Chlamydiae bacterium RIFCSPHIGHO2_12_FULL_27_8]